MKNIKHLIIYSILIFISISESWSQKVVFCEQVNSKGLPKNIDDTYYLTNSSKEIFIYYFVDEEFGVSEFNMEIFYNGVYVYEFPIKVDSKFNYFYQALNFSIPGKYTIYVVDTNKQELAYNNLFIKSKTSGEKSLKSSLKNSLKN